MFELTVPIVSSRENDLHNQAELIVPTYKTNWCIVFVCMYVSIY